MISVLDYGAGNIGSVIRMFERAGGESQRIGLHGEAVLGRAKGRT